MAAFPKDIYTEPDFDPDTLANLGPLTGMAGIWEGSEGNGRPPGRREHRDGRVPRALRAAAHRSAEQRPAAPPRASLPRPHREARRGRDLPRPGWLLALGSGHEDGPPDACHPPRPGGAGIGESRARCPEVHRSIEAGPHGERHLLEPIPGARLPDAGVVHHHLAEEQPGVLLHPGDAPPDPGAQEALPAHRREHAPSHRRAHAQPHRGPEAMGRGCPPVRRPTGSPRAGAPPSPIPGAVRRAARGR